MSPKVYMWVNGLIFQTVWFACILGSQTLAMVATVCFLTLHGQQKHTESLLPVTLLALVGFLMDYCFSLLGYLELNSETGFPIFLLCIWLAFSATIYHSSQKLFLNNITATIAGLLAPFSYIAAEKLGKVSYTAPLYKGIILHALLWCSLMLIISKFWIKKEISSNAR